MNTRRDTVLDITKAIGIILMVMGHLHFSEDVFDKYIYAFHMPLFFIVSGILFISCWLHEKAVFEASGKETE